MAEARRSRRRLRRIAPLAALVVVLAAASAAYAANSGGGPSYVTGLVTRADVQQTLNLTGSVQQVNEISAAFPVSGMVTSVGVTVGQQVSAGQELARIDPGPLQTDLLEAQAGLAQAQATLQNDESGTSSSTATATTSAATTGPTNTAPTNTAPTNTAPTNTATLAAFTPTGAGQGAGDLNSLERAVTAAQAQAASSQAAVNSALLAAISACATSPSPSPSGTPSPTPSGSATPTPSSSASAGTTASPTSGSSCATALTAVQRAEAAEAAATKALATAVSKLAAAAAAAGSSTGGGSSAGAGSKSGRGGGASSTSGSGGTSSGSTFAGGGGGGGGGGGSAASSGAGTNSLSRIASDQASVTTAQVAVTDAQRNLDAAVLRAPMAGTIAAVGITEGSTASTSSAITIVSQGAARVTIDVPLASMPALKPGQVAYVTPNGATTADKGTVASIGLLPASGNSSTATYPVTVLVPDSDLMQLPTGSSAQVSLVMNSVHNAVTVPNSAVTRFGTGGTTAFVTVLDNGKATRTRVTTGAVGTLATQIVSGLKVGQIVVLADKSAALPANSSTSTRVFGTGGGGGFPGFGGGGFHGFSGFAGRTG